MIDNAPGDPGPPYRGGPFLLKRYAVMRMDMTDIIIHRHRHRDVWLRAVASALMKAGGHVRKICKGGNGAAP